MEIVREFPIKFPEEKKKKNRLAIYKWMQDNPIKPGMWIEELSVEKIDSSLFTKKRTLDFKPWICWKLGTSDTTKFIGPLIADNLL